ncbi:MAG: hypothetical protein QOH41_728 [Blastocatellia bacterium]|jgi:hypothetical protein|nr:hypothetical protein [Blastocatellia bacterium]
MSRNFQAWIPRSHPTLESVAVLGGFLFPGSSAPVVATYS